MKKKYFDDQFKSPTIKPNAEAQFLGKELSDSDKSVDGTLDLKVMLKGRSKVDEVHVGYNEDGLVTSIGYFPDKEEFYTSISEKKDSVGRTKREAILGRAQEKLKKTNGYSNEDIKVLNELMGSLSEQEKQAAINRTINVLAQYILDMDNNFTDIERRSGMGEASQEQFRSELAKMVVYLQEKGAYKVLKKVG